MATLVLNQEQQKTVRVGEKAGELAGAVAGGLVTHAAATATASTMAGTAASNAATAWFTAHAAPTFANFAAAAASAKAKSLAIGGLGSLLGGAFVPIALPLAGAYLGAKLVEWYLTSDDD
jgi:hypothetical protein